MIWDISLLLYYNFWKIKIENDLKYYYNNYYSNCNYNSQNKNINDSVDYC